MTRAPEGDYQRMHEAVGRLVWEYGLNIARDPAQFKAVLGDVAAGYPKPYRAVVAAVDAGVLADLVERRELTESAVRALAATVVTHAADDGADAEWAVRALAAACSIPIVPATGAGSAPPAVAGHTVSSRPAGPSPVPGVLVPTRQAVSGPLSDPDVGTSPLPRRSGEPTGRRRTLRKVALVVLATVLVLGAVLASIAALGGGSSDPTARDRSGSGGVPKVLTTVTAGRSANDVALSPDGRRAYVTLFDDGSNAGHDVSVIDTASNTVAATVTVGKGPASVAVSPDGRRAYVTNQDSANVSVIDTVSNTVTATIPVGDTPTTVVVSPDGRHAYVADLDVSVIDTASNTAAKILLGSDQKPFALAVSPDGRHVYVSINATNTAPGPVLVIDTATNTVTATIGVGWDPKGVAVSPDGRHVYITNRGPESASGNTVSVIDTATNAVTATIGVGKNPDEVAVSPDGRHAYVTNGGTDDAPGTTMSVIDTASNIVTSALTVGSGPAGVAVSPDGRRAYVMNYLSSSMSVIDTGVG